MQIIEQFVNARNLIVGNEINRLGIGSLGEKTLHAVLKHTFEPDASKHEIKIGGFFADIVNLNGITEVQTRSFNALRKRLAFFLENYIVTIVYPIAQRKWLVWIDPETGECTKRRKSPKTGKACEILDELYRIKPFLTHSNLRLRLVMLDIIEYRNLNGWNKDRKKGSSRFDRIPEDIHDEVEINDLEDYVKLIPDGLPKVFAVKDFFEKSGLSLKKAGTALNVLKYVSAVVQVGKNGRALLYEATNSESSHHKED